MKKFAKGSGKAVGALQVANCDRSSDAVPGIEEV
jgi:hypothetical protein